MSLIRRTAVAVLIPLTVVAVANVAPSGEASAAAVPCRDSNGARPGGSVYVADGATLRCDVSPPQRLHVTRTSAARCADMGGHGYVPTVRICWDVDY